MKLKLNDLTIPDKEMKKNKISKRKKIMIIIFTIIALIAAAILIFLNSPQFGRLPKGERLERVQHSDHYKNGQFQNLHPAPQITDKFLEILRNNIFGKNEHRNPKQAIPSVKTNLYNISVEENILVWMGHSSYYMQINGKRILVDPVFSKSGAPVSFINKAFKGANIYTAEDIPELDYLVITHDHWDHLDYPTVKKLQHKIKKIVCPLGIGEDFERWGFTTKIIEMDWQDKVQLDDNVMVYCFPTRHFSGRGLKPRQTQWASFLFQTPSFKVYIGGDSGYDTHFAEIGDRFGTIDLAILENGQYNKAWKYIHMFPEETLQAGKDLHAKKVLPVHNSKFALSNHDWNAPLKTITALHHPEDFILLTPMIGEPVDLNVSHPVSKAWWTNIE